MLYNIFMSLPITKDTISDVGIHILNGMTEKEACILADVSWTELQKKKEDNEIIRDFVEKKHTEFKANHLKEIQKNKSEKTSMWMLEKLRPDEFGSGRSRQDAPQTINIISAIIRDIQNDNQGIVSISRGSRTQPEGESNEDDPKLRIAEILN